ncbi:hypothetical protein, partial [Nocardia asiatica]|uniref:hypothetical protein n=1 Tax=Nocardia asiatica TaxID=209252 RepID=UPI00313AAAEC
AVRIDWLLIGPSESKVAPAQRNKCSRPCCGHPIKSGTTDIGNALDVWYARLGLRENERGVAEDLWSLPGVRPRFLRPAPAPPPPPPRRAKTPPFTPPPRRSSARLGTW